MTRPLTRLAAVLAIASTALLVSACAAPAPESAPQPSETVGAAAPESSAKPETEATPATDVAASDEPTCETIISPTTAADFDSLGWTALADSFTVGSVALAEGIQCVWGDFSTATDNIQIFGWAPITETQAEIAEDDLIAEGWRREESDEGVYLTENPETAVAVDKDGHGRTYLFGDGWVKYADTKQGIVLVEWPQS